jgi:hypothetical protein
MNRRLLHITSVPEFCDLANRLNEECSDKFILQNEDGTKSTEIKTTISIIYALSEFDKIYLVNETNDGVFPDFV